jgi:cyclic pyranopterin monophosphate synthase
MVDITHKISTLREATAKATVFVSKQETIEAVQNNAVPKGNVFEMAKTAGLFAVKNTHLSIPDCHPLPIEYTAVNYEINDLSIDIEVIVKTIYKTGVEVEAMHAAAIVALTMYDMLKPIDNQITIGNIGLVSKKGGKSSFKSLKANELSAAVVVCSDKISSGVGEDKAGKAIIEKLQHLGVRIGSYTIIPDDFDTIQELAKSLSEQNRLIIFTGGTGLSPRDVTPQALTPLFETEIPGVVEAIRSYGQQRTPFSMLSRSVAGTIGSSLILALPGSTKGAAESIDAVFPHILHVFNVFSGARHD